MIRGGLQALAAAGLGLLAVVAVQTTPVALEPGSPAWARVVRGDPGGDLRQRAVAIVPGVDRARPGRLIVRLAGGSGELSVRLDGGPVQPVRVPAGGLVLPLAAAASPGLRLELSALPGGSPAPRLALLSVESRGGAGPAAFAFLMALGTATVAGRLLATAPAAALGLAAGGLLGLANAPPLLWLSLPTGGAVARLAAALLPLALASFLARRTPPAERRLALHAAGILACAVFGAWIRAAFLPSSGSWDMEYWKAWMMRTVTHGVTGAYGDADAVPPGRFVAQLRGEEEPWRVDWRGRTYFVDYPPLAMAAWRASHAAAGVLGYASAERENVGAKLPAVAGDLLAWPVLLYALRRRPLRALWAGALYWALPVSWLSSGVLGYLDGAYAPVLALAVAAAGEGRSRLAGAALAAACLVKPTGVVVAPAMVAALLAARAPVAAGVASGLAVVAAALVPYALAGTLPTAVVHVYRILFQERLSGGFPNLWWLLGHSLTLGPEGWIGAVRYARVELLPLPARPVGALLFGAAAAWVLAAQRGRRGAAPALLAGAALVFAYGMLAVGVHENHPHPLFLLLLATGLRGRRLAALWTAAAASYVLNMLLLSGIGRFHGPRYEAIEPTAAWLSGWRLAPGFDATLLLAALNVLLFAALLAVLSRELRQLEAT